MSNHAQSYLQHLHCPACRQDLTLVKAPGSDEVWQARVSPEEPHPVEWVVEVVRSCLGVRVSDHGYLERPYGGHEGGTPYVDLIAECGDDREHARALLEEVSGLPALAWECGWSVCGSGRDQVTTLRLFPDLEVDWEAA
jgi:hypothetical protein